MKASLRNLMGYALLAAPACVAAQTPSAPPPAPTAQPGVTATAGPQSGTAPQTPSATTIPPAQTAAPVAQPGAPMQSAASYVIGPDDGLNIVVWQDAKLSGTVPVRPDGMISLSLVGDVQAAGKTPMELAHDLTEKLKQFITDPTVSVTVMAVNSKRIFMIGEVGHVGPVPMTIEMTALQAIASAGGLSPYANKGKIYILRVVNGKQTKIPFNYKKALKGDDQGPKLLAGDTIVVP